MALNNRNQALVKEFEARLAFFEALRENPYGDGTSLNDPEKIDREEMSALIIACEQLNNHLDNVNTMVYSSSTRDQCKNIHDQFADLTEQQLVYMSDVWRDAVSYASNDPDNNGLH